MSVQSIHVQGQAAWLKAYAERGQRAWRLGALDLAARGLGIRALRPPRHGSDAEARDIEARRIRELERQGVLVPELLGGSEDMLVLSDLGRNLAGYLRDARGDHARTDRLAAQAIAAIAAAHARGAYLGQPLPRNITLDADGRIGFIDFEEDPLDVMSLRDAQTRDWLIFSYGMAKYYHGRPQVLADMIAAALKKAGTGVGEHAVDAGRRLGWIASATKWMGKASRPLVTAVAVLQSLASHLPAALLVLAVALIDFLPDRELDLLELLF